jgi:hypothetical protein
MGPVVGMQDKAPVIAMEAIMPSLGGLTSNFISLAFVVEFYLLSRCYDLRPMTLILGIFCNVTEIILTLLHTQNH